MTAATAHRRAVVPDADYHQNRYASALDGLVTRGCRWLDLGAGVRIHGGWGGTRQAELAQRARVVIGSELHAEHLRTNPFLTDRCLADGVALPFDSESFDVVSANMVMEHLPEPHRVIAEVARVLVPGGKVVFVTPNRTHPAVWVSAALVSMRSRRQLAHRVERRQLEHVFPTYYRCNTEGEVRRVAAASGLHVEQLERFSSFPLFKDGPALARWLEERFVLIVRNPALSALRSNILGVLSKPSS